mgnify:CR=1 FL=1
MLIPLDYYRILGVPIQADSSQLGQAYQQRLAHVPHPDYSQTALTLRRQLLDEAYKTLTVASDRQTYDAQFLAKSYAEGPQLTTPDGAGVKTPNLDIDDRQFTGAIALLHELGEYELAIKLGYPYLSQPQDVEAGRFGEPNLALADLLLTVVLSYLELGREQWQGNQSEQAASSLKIAQELLLHHGLFAGLRGEIQGDLYRLRPYRVLELLASPDANGVAHRQGLQLLRSMLKERGGIDGNGDDRSGLGVEEFLRFIQQIRGYLSAQEQLALFEAEARRPSAVATYLASYALIAQGFSQRQPAFVQRSSLLLRRLGQRQDVFLEQAICALLLGQPDEACQYLAKSQEAEPLDAIRSRSGNSPDLLPGLCAYCEQWLASEVLPHFRDLNTLEVSLTRYFSDPGVQAYLESMPDEAEVTGDNTWSTTVPDPNPASLAAVGRSGERSLTPPSHPPIVPPKLGGPNSVPTTPFAKAKASDTPPEAIASHTADDDSNGNTSGDSGSAPFQPILLGPLGERPVTNTPASSPQVSVPNGTNFAAGTATLPNTTAFTGAPSSLRPLTSPTVGADSNQGTAASSARGIPTPGISTPGASVGDMSSDVPSTNPALDRLGRGSGSAPPLDDSSFDGVGDTPPRERRRRDSGESSQGSLAILVGGSLLAVVLFGFLIVQAYGAIARLFQGDTGPTLEPNQPTVYLDRPSTEIPAPDTATGPEGAVSNPAVEGDLDPAIAKAAVENWLSAKARAMGQEYDAAALEAVLVDPMLRKWRGRVRATKASGEHWTYEHAVEISDITVNTDNPERGTVIAQVREVAKLYQGDRLSNSGSYDDQLRVRYNLVFVDGQWLISDGKVL